MGVAAMALIAATTPPAAWAQNAAELEAGRAKAQACAVCHGAVGIANVPDAPHLAGMNAIYFSAQMRAYRSGARRHEVMAVMARQLNDDDIALLASWYAAIKIEAKSPLP
jgi:cytochrome c553